MNKVLYPGKQEWAQLLKRPELDYAGIEKTVESIFEQVQQSGDSALVNLTRSIDGVELNSLKVSLEEFEEARQNIDNQLKKAITQAKSNIEKFHNYQKNQPKVVETTPGVKCWQKSVAIESVGLYIPGGSAPLFSTVLMLGVPAVIAGCKEIVLCTPPNKEGKVHPAILYTAQYIGIQNIFKVGGAQAIAAMAFGTESIPKVYKIFGPGNPYVTVAKQKVLQYGVAIDMPAGPSEVLVVADDSAIPSFVASDLLAQAEHGPDSQVLLVTSNENIIPAIEAELQKQLEALPRKEIASKALEHSKIIVLKNENEIVELINEYAPEHLIIATHNAMELADRVVNAGSVFIGNLTPESAGDYASGTNHTLPTHGFAKIYSGVNLDSFVKKITFQHITDYGIFNLGSTIEQMAEEEQLYAHKNSVSLRLKYVVNKYCHDKLG
ncbi:MAG: histidinol dehydrogenase [Bacteroidales bacterium]|nr:histidinol dehydrogenase [Bacteroidales bacterium]